MVSEVVAISLIAHFVYNGVIDLSFYFAIVTPVIATSIYMWKKVNTKDGVSRSIVVQIVLVFMLPVVFGLFRPEYTFFQAKTLVAQQIEYLNGFMVGDKHYNNITMSNSPNFFVRKAYLISISKDNGIESYIVFDPISGNYRFLE